MNKVLLFILSISTIASAQVLRYDNFAATTASASGIGNLMQIIPNATITVFNQPAAGGSCASGGCTAATTYTSPTGLTACGGGLPLTRPAANTCLATSDLQGNFGFWIVAGTYQYCIAATNFPNQCFNFVVGGSKIIHVDGSTYPFTCAGINSAIGQVGASLTGTVIIDASGGQIPCGSTSINMASNVCLVGAGPNKSTVLRWTTPTDTVSYPAGTTYTCMSNLTLSYPQAVGNCAIKVNTTDANPVTHNLWRDINIIWDAQTSGLSAAFCVNTQASPSFTDFTQNTIENVSVSNSNQMVACAGCEGNRWIIRGENIGVSAGTNMMLFTVPNADEIIDARVEAASTSATPLTCLALQGSNNLVRLTCDGASAAQTLSAINDTGTFNILDIDGAIGTGTFSVGTVGVGSQVRFVTSATGLTATYGANYRALTGAGSGVAPTFSQTFNALFGDITAASGTGCTAGSCKDYGVVGAAKISGDSNGDRAYGLWGKATASVNANTEVGGHAETTDAGTAAAPSTLLELVLAGATKFWWSGTGHANVGAANGDYAGKTACSGSTITKTFAIAYNSTPVVLVFDETTKGGANLTAISGSAFTVSCTGATDALDYIVIGNPN